MIARLTQESDVWIGGKARLADHAQIGYITKRGSQPSLSCSYSLVSVMRITVDRVAALPHTESGVLAGMMYPVPRMAARMREAGFRWYHGCTRPTPNSPQTGIPRESAVDGRDRPAAMGEKSVCVASPFSGWLGLTSNADWARRRGSLPFARTSLSTNAEAGFASFDRMIKVESIRLGNGYTEFTHILILIIANRSSRRSLSE